MIESEVDELLASNKSLSLLELNSQIIEIIKDIVQKFLQETRQYVSAETFNDTTFYEIEHLLECNYLLNVINMLTNYKISRVIRFEGTNIFYAEKVEGAAIIIKFVKLTDSSFEEFNLNQVMNSLEVLSFPYKFFSVLSKRDKTNSIDLLTSIKNKKMISRNPREEFIFLVKAAINKLRSQAQKINPTTVAKEISKIKNERFPRSTFVDQYKNWDIEWIWKKKVFKDLQTGEEF